jgi:hypothetical protein
MSTHEVLEMVSIAISFIVGIVGGVIGAYVGMKVGIAKLETWREVFAQAIHEAQGDIRVLNEDSLIHDTELSAVMTHLQIARSRRQRMRD